MSQIAVMRAKMPYIRASVWCVPCVVYFIIFVALTKDSVAAHQLKHPSLDFRKHLVAIPTIHHARTKRELSSTRDTAGLHHPELTLTLDVEGEQYTLDLRLNRALVPPGHVLRYRRGGRHVHTHPTDEELDICQYQGSIRGVEHSWAAVSTCHGVSGVLYDGRTMRYIEPAGPTLDSHHYIYDHADLQSEKTCGYKGGHTKNKTEHLDRRKRSGETVTQHSRPSRYKRAAEETQVRGPYSENKLSRYLELVLVSDHDEYLANGASVAAVHHKLKDVANIINSMYAPLNIFIALVGVVVWSEVDEIQLLTDGDETLTNFLHYRRRELVSRIPNDNAQLLTRLKFKDGVVGKALKGPICTYELSGGVATNHSEVIGLVAATIAHEMGHNFGMEHDTEEDCKCPDDKCIMSPSSTSVMPLHWSSCSLKSLALAFEKGMDYCLRNKPTKLFESPTCGNGFVEPGEQCDCGLIMEPGARNKCTACCHPDTCMLRSNATCATGMCCDLETCRPKSAGTVCRAAERECDLPEHCSGHSEHCPEDVFKMDATPCDNHQAYCVKGSCRSHSAQCRLLWGPTGGKSHDACYTKINNKTDKHGNCGYDRLQQRYVRCERPDDLHCGLLHCQHLNEQLAFGIETGGTLQTHTFININGKIEPCRTVLVDLGLGQVDPGMVPDGARCGDEKMCMSQKCVTVSSVLAAVSSLPTAVCPSNCSGHGVCNSNGHCHCEPGFSPPLCELPGPGGSYDSGPATDPSVQRNFMVAMYVIFLGIIPTILLLMFLFYYCKQNGIHAWGRSKKSMQSPKKNSLQRRISRSASKFAANFHSQSHPPAPPVNVHTLSSPDDMSSSLLRNDSDRSPTGNINPTVNFFGNFKGFSLTPVEKTQPRVESPVVVDKDAGKSAKITPVHRSGSNSQSVLNQGVAKPVLRSAPPLPVVPVAAKQNSPKASPSVKRNNSAVQNKIKALIGTDRIEEPHPVMNNPPPRPVISSPILEASTCTAKELISPLQGSKTMGPVRSAPGVPGASPDLPKRPLSMHSAGNVLLKPLPEEPKKVKEGISLNRIASFLKHEKPKEKERSPVERSHSLPKNPNHLVRVPKTVDKVALRNLQISNPILQKEIDVPANSISVVSDSEDGDDPKSFANRTQSMRGPPVTQKPVIQSFGSMRQPPGAPRPVSGVGRPTAPPPPLPNHETKPAPSIYQTPKPTEIKSTDYVDCIDEIQAPLAHIDEEGDNIYAIIEESPEKHAKLLPGVPPPIKTIPQPPPVGYNTPKPITSNSGSTESMGLLGEIVNEIQNRNFDSIYSTSTLARKKKEREKQNAQNRDSTYMNTEYKTPESVYSNSGAKSTVSTTSSGYLNPAAVNVPTFQKIDTKEADEAEKPPPSPTMKINSKIPTFSRQVTPPGLKTTSTFRSVPQSPKGTPRNVTQKPITVNSPDVVSSCAGADTKNAKPPDVINNNKLANEGPKVAVKPNLAPKTNDNARPPLKPTPISDKKPTLKTTPSLKSTNSSTSLKSDKNPPLNRANSKVDSSVKAMADNLNKNKPKVVPKPASIAVQKADSNVKPNATKLSSKPSNVASLQQKFENRKSVGRDMAVKK
ncbi:disintegrin and metalloproteinase domain-containing protein 19 [Plutella xylostella]|uniref:disintegrin and metalloproteinase domain-containing protein 19 n=1 Tax=Plutella xylostella TaxID=51655 RepID=UPI002032A213|nr:disintegrin and metalloproteinase domain-containing protein 19 [Plutella xylostella]